MALFFFGVHLFGNDGEDDGEAVAAGDGEELLVVGAEEHVVADGIEGVGIGSEQAELHHIVAADGIVMDKLWLSAGIGQAATLQGYAFACGNGVFKNNEGVLHGFSVFPYQVLRFYLGDLHGAIIA